MRFVSARAREALYAQETGEAILSLLVLSHPTLEAPLRFVNNMEDVWSTIPDDPDAPPLAEPGLQYLGCPFQITLPDERDDQLPVVQLAIDNVDQAIVAAVRDMTVPPTVALRLVLASTPNVLEAGPFNFTLKSAQYDSQQVVGTLAFTNILNEPFPWRTFTPGDWPGVFA